MTAKDWLMRAWNLDCEITALQEAKERSWQRCLTSAPLTIGALPAAHKKDVHEQYTAYANLDEKLSTQIRMLCEIKAEITDAICLVQDSTLRSLLTERYLNLKTWEAIAECMNYSYMQICRLHTKALDLIEEIRRRYGML